MRKEKTSLGKIKLKKGKSESKQKDFEKLLQRTKSLIKFYRSESKNLILENEQLEKVNEKLKMGKT